MLSKQVLFYFKLLLAFGDVSLFCRLPVSQVSISSSSLKTIFPVLHFSPSSIDLFPFPIYFPLLGFPFLSKPLVRYGTPGQCKASWKNLPPIMKLRLGSACCLETKHHGLKDFFSAHSPPWKGCTGRSLAPKAQPGAATSPSLAGIVLPGKKALVYFHSANCFDRESARAGGGGGNNVNINLEAEVTMPGLLLTL